MNTKDMIEKLASTLQNRIVVYRRAIASLKEHRDQDLRKIFQHYQEESQRFIEQLQQGLTLHRDRSAQPITTAEPKIIRIISDDVLSSTQHDIGLVLSSCMSVEEDCKTTYTQTIKQMDEKLVSLSYSLREQAEQQYMAYNHINTLFECNILNTRAV